MIHYAHFVAAEPQSVCKLSFSPGNLIPHHWYNQITDDKGTPDLLAIILLSDLVGWFRYLGTNQTKITYQQTPVLHESSLAVSYEYLQKKFNASRERIRKALVRLEQLHIISREIRNIVIHDGYRNNQLFISLNQVFIEKCFRDPELDIRASAHTPSPQIQGDLIIRNNIELYKNRSTSNFIFTKKLEHKTKIHGSALEKKRTLKDFYPLTQAQCDLLQHQSGREFNLHAMNEILKNIATRLSDRYFKTQTSFLNYMAKIFANEMRQAAQINNNSFYIKSTLGYNADISDSKHYNERAKFLNEIEQLRNTSLDTRLKKKLASTLGEETAYNILKAYVSCTRAGNVCTLQLAQEVKLTVFERQAVLQQVQAVFEDTREDVFNPITNCKITVNANKIQDYKSLAQDTQSANFPEAITCFTHPPEFLKFQEILRQHHGKDTYVAWFSKLSCNIDRGCLTIYTGSKLVKDWLLAHYYQSFDIAAKQCSLSFIGVEIT